MLTRVCQHLLRQDAPEAASAIRSYVPCRRERDFSTFPNNKVKVTMAHKWPSRVGADLSIHGLPTPPPLAPGRTLAEVHSLSLGAIRCSLPRCSLPLAGNWRPELRHPLHPSLASVVLSSSDLDNFDSCNMRDGPLLP